MAQFIIANGPMPTTASFAKVATGTSIKTMLQVMMGATLVGKIIEWGCSFDAIAAATPGVVELIETGTVAATVTASVAADFGPADGLALLCGNPTTALFQVGTTQTGYTASGEGSIVTTRPLDGPQMIAPTVSPFIRPFQKGQEPIIQVGKIMRIRMNFATSVNALCWVKIEV